MTEKEQQVRSDAEAVARVKEAILDYINSQMFWGEYGERITMRQEASGFTIRVYNGNCKDAVLNVRNPKRSVSRIMVDCLAWGENPHFKTYELKNGIKFIIKNQL
jgi:hypothetical protein